MPCEYTSLALPLSGVEGRLLFVVLCLIDEEQTETKQIGTILDVSLYTGSFYSDVWTRT